MLLPTILFPFANQFLEMLLKISLNVQINQKLMDMIGVLKRMLNKLEKK